MAGLVACDTLGESIIQWLNGASEEDKARLCAALGCGPTVNDIMGALTDCKGAALSDASTLATCQDLAEALLNLPLNQGEDLPADATDCSRPVTICGVTNIFNGLELNPAQQAVFNAWMNVYNGDEDARLALLTALASKDPGNLLQVRPDGLYYGVEAPDDIREMYVDAVNGDDSNPGTREAPMQTLRECFLRGPAGVNRDVYLFEGQEHVVLANVNAGDNTTVRGGIVSMYPYGPVSDNLPPVAGDIKYAQAAARDLNTRIVAGPTVNREIGAQVYQVSTAMRLTNNAQVITAGISYTANGDNNSGFLRARSKAAFNDQAGPGAWNIRWGYIRIPATGYAFTSDPDNGPFSLTVANGVIVEGDGQLIGDYRLRDFSLTVTGDNTTRDQVIAHITPKPVVAVQPINEFSTNLDGAMWP